MGDSKKIIEAAKLAIREAWCLESCKINRKNDSLVNIPDVKDLNINQLKSLRNAVARQVQQLTAETSRGDLNLFSKDTLKRSLESRSEEAYPWIIEDDPTSLAAPAEDSCQHALRSETDREELYTKYKHDSYPFHSVPINKDVRSIDWKALQREVKFDAIMTDPPWVLATERSTRGVHLSYNQLNDDDIANVPFYDLLNDDGLLFIWVVNNRYTAALDLIEQWGLQYIDQINWIKTTSTRKQAKGHGFYFQHAKETCFVASKGNPKVAENHGCADTFFAERRGQSQKPEEVYRLIEKLFPTGECFSLTSHFTSQDGFWRYLLDGIICETDGCL
eukprot:TRINITY_DN1970_c0_g1_i1.p1 TRINITY_DN1970_c0_g1~~TRINITY_DN1970_c0_g1_i1.p1  ORF type:complete len:333 (+),score=37.95 TRINITY_DN1970_c0_g1_i1:80-1078(+)